MIEISGLCKSFGRLQAVDNLSFNVCAGEVLGVLGPNGAGKSTCMKMITGFLSPDSGEIKIDSHSLSTDPILVKEMIGYLPEGAPSYGDMTVLAFLNFIAELRGLSKAYKQQRLDQVLEKLQLNEVKQQRIETLSKGFKRRVGLAQAILHDPKVLILDEPTDGLDPNQKQQVRALIHNLARDKIVIISTHILEEVSAVCSRAIIIHQGRLVADGTPAQLRSQSKYCRAVTVEIADGTDNKFEIMAMLESIDGVDHVRDDSERDNTYTIFPKNEKDIYEKVYACLNKNNWPIRELHIEQGRLDDVFHQLTGGEL